MKPEVKVKLLPHFRGNIPKYQTAGAAGCDVHACVDKPITLKTGERALIPTGMILEIPQGYEIQVRPRSGLALKNGITIPNSPGTIDSDYRGELKIIIMNWGNDAFTVNDGDRVAQLVLAPVVQAVFTEAAHVTETERGAGGFGSSGVGLG